MTPSFPLRPLPANRWKSPMMIGAASWPGEAHRPRQSAPPLLEQNVRTLHARSEAALFSLPSSRRCARSVLRPFSRAGACRAPCQLSRASSLDTEKFRGWRKRDQCRGRCLVPQNSTVAFESDEDRRNPGPLKPGPIRREMPLGPDLTRDPRGKNRLAALVGLAGHLIQTGIAGWRCSVRQKCADSAVSAQAQRVMGIRDACRDLPSPQFLALAVGHDIWASEGNQRTIREPPHEKTCGWPLFDHLSMDLDAGRESRGTDRDRSIPFRSNRCRRG